MFAVLTAGGTPKPGEPFFEHTRGQPKALLDINGKPMIQWVLDALEASPSVEHTVIIGLPPDFILKPGVKPRSFLADRGGLLQNLQAGVRKVAELNPEARHILASASDIPALTPEVAEWAIGNATTDDDVYYSVITRKVMEKRYPGSRRTYLKLRDCELCGGDLNVIKVSAVTGRDVLWEKLIASRKSPFKQASLLGYDLLAAILLHLVTLEGLIKTVSKRLNIKGRAVVCPYASIGMDVDKPHQLEIMRANLVQNAGSIPG
jgi:GTP:adenosylcobinamide-phosphate guanylyltransferase